MASVASDAIPPSEGVSGETSAAPEGAAPTAEKVPAAAEDAAAAVAPLQPIIIKKIIDEGHAGGHGGAWKIALADMMTAMMAFFLLMWLLGATNADQRKSIAEYFQPTNRPVVDKSGGSNGFFGGMSLIDPKSLPMTLTQTGINQLTAPGTEEYESTSEDQALPQGLSEEERQKIASNMRDASQGNKDKKDLSIMDVAANTIHKFFIQNNDEDGLIKKLNISQSREVMLNN